MSQTTRIPIFSIPTSTENSANFIQRLKSLIIANSTHIYIDTSFLMWMTKIGSRSRSELIGWLQSNCASRVHVPIWAAHEYLKHHVAGTIATDLAAKSDELAALIRRTYREFRPFIDEPLGEGAKDPAAIRAATRKALHTLGELPTIGRQWQRSYETHASQVIAFINDVTPEKTSLYKNLKDISTIGNNRFVGSVPPGTKDQKKKGAHVQSKQSGDDSPISSNRYGDLLFWREILLHAKHMNAKTVVVISNDRKNDWHLGGRQTVDVDPSLRALKKEWKPVPRPHPMLVMEAKLVADIGRVELLDSAYLAALLREMANDEVQSFADVAIIPDGPERLSESDRRAQLLEQRIAADTAKVRAETLRKGYLFPDPVRVRDTQSSLARALLDSRQPLDPQFDAILEQWRASVEARRPLSETLSPPTFTDFDHRILVMLARELHDRVVQQTAGYGEAVADLVSILEQLPPKTAASLYLGLLSSMYLIRESNHPRLPPHSPVAQQLFEMQSADFSPNAIWAVRKRLTGSDFAPLYLPATDCPTLKIAIDTEWNVPIPDQLRSLKIDAVELLTPAQLDDSLRLGSLFDSNELVDGASLVNKACELFCIPIAQVNRQEIFEQSYALTDTIGFKRPIDIFVPKELPNGE